MSNRSYTHTHTAPQPTIFTWFLFMFIIYYYNPSHHYQIVNCVTPNKLIMAIVYIDSLNNPTIHTEIYIYIGQQGRRKKRTNNEKSHDVVKVAYAHRWGFYWTIERQFACSHGTADSKCRHESICILQIKKSHGLFNFCVFFTLPFVDIFCVELALGDMQCEWTNRYRSGSV